MALLLGLDPSTVKLGWAVTDLETGKPHSCGAGDVKKTQKLWPRLDDAYTQILSDADLDYADIRLIYMEQMFHGANAATTVKLAEACGVLLVVCWDKWRGVPLERITPGEWRKVLGIPHQGKEGPAAKAVSMGFDTGGDQDAADAACIAMAGWVINDRGIALAREEGAFDS